MLFQWAGIGFGYRPAARAVPGTMDFLAITATQIMPIGQWLTLRTQAIGAGQRQPWQIVHHGRRQVQTIRHQSLAVPIVPALRRRRIEQFAGDIGRIDAPGIFVFHLVQATFAAAIAQGLPLRGVEAGQRRFPKGDVGHRRVIGPSGRVRRRPMLARLRPLAYPDHQ